MPTISHSLEHLAALELGVAAFFGGWNTGQITMTHITKTIQNILVVIIRLEQIRLRTTL